MVHIIYKSYSEFPSDFASIVSGHVCVLVIAKMSRPRSGVYEPLNSSLTILHPTPSEVAPDTLLWKSCEKLAVSGDRKRIVSLLWHFGYYVDTVKVTRSLQIASGCGNKTKSVNVRK